MTRHERQVLACVEEICWRERSSLFAGSRRAI